MAGDPAGIRLLHVGVLWSFGIAKPLYDVLSGDPAFLVARDLTPVEIVVASVALTVGPPLVLSAPSLLLSRISGPAGAAAHLLAVGVTAAMIATQAVQTVFSGTVSVLAFGAFAGGAFAAAYAHAQPVRWVLSLLGPTPAIFAILFIFASPVTDVILPGEEGHEPLESVGSPAPVVIVVFDELPAVSLLDGQGEIDGTRFPGFAELARNSTWYRYTASPATRTHLALPALLAGRTSGSNVPPTLAEYPRNLFTALAGHREMNVTEPVTALCPRDLCAVNGGTAKDRLHELVLDLGVVAARRVLPPAMADDLSPVNEGFAHFLAQSDASEKQFEEFLSSLRRRPRGLNFLHLPTVPHFPLRRLPSGETYEAGLGISDVAPDVGAITGQAAITRHLWQRHLLQTGYADLLLQRLLATLRRTGLWERAVLVVASDHGVAHLPGRPRRTPTPETVGLVGGVPLFVRNPRGPARRVIERVHCISEVPRMVLAALRASPIPPASRDCRSRVSVTAYGIRSTVSAGRFIRQQRAAAVRQNVLFGGGPRWSGLYRAGDGRGLIGRGAGELERGGPAAMAATVTSPEGSAIAEASLSGADARRGREIAVSVGKRIAAVATIFELDGQMRIAAVLPPAARGRPVRALHLIAAGGDPHLREIPIGE